MIDPSVSSTIECTTDCGWMTTSIWRPLTPNSQCASMTSSPLFISVAESMVIFRPICQVGCFSASAADTACQIRRRAAAERSARRGENQPPDVAAARGRAGTDEWRCARCRPAGSRRRACAAASVTMPPAMTSTSLLASAIVLRCSIAASTASSASVPLDAHSTTSASGCEATATSPSRPLPAIVTPLDRSRLLQPIDRRAGRHRDDARTIARDLLREQLGVLARREADDLQPIGVRVDDRERAPADRAGRSEDGDALHWLDHQPQSPSLLVHILSTM